MPSSKAPGIRCPIQGHQSGTERKCADMFRKSWKPRLEELYAREHGVRTPPLSVSPDPCRAPSTPVNERPNRAQRVPEPGTETSPLLPGRLATPSNRWVVRSYGAMQSRDILWLASRVEALTPPMSPISESSTSSTLTRTSQTNFKAAQQAQQDLDLEAGRMRDNDEKSPDIALQLGDEEGTDWEYNQVSRRTRARELCKRTMLVLLAALWMFMIVMAFRDRHGFFLAAEIMK